MPDASTQTLLLARHGQTADNAGGLILGRRDPPLSALGLEQARALAAAAKDAGLAVVWSSPLRRARATAAIVAEATGARVSVLDALAESDRGAWEGRPVAELRRDAPTLFVAFETAADGFAFPGGESLSHQVARTRAALDRIADGPQPALVIAHVGTIRAALLASGRRPPPESDIPHATIEELAWPPPDAGREDRDGRTPTPSG